MNTLPTQFNSTQLNWPVELSWV